MLRGSDLLQARARSLMIWLVSFMGLLFLRVCYLTLFKSTELGQLAHKPSYRYETIPAARGLIFDRNKEPLALNRLCYRVGVCYRDFMIYPSIRAIWVGGKRKKIYPRKERVAQLVALLKDHLPLSSTEIEDFIYSEAALTPSQTIILDGDVDEKTFYRLKIAEPTFAGLRVSMGLKRYYPKGSIAGQLIGFLGPVNAKERAAQFAKLGSLRAQKFIEENPRSLEIIEHEIETLTARIKNIDQWLGKAGVELSAQTQLQGEEGRLRVRLNAHGHALESLEEKSAQRGKDITLCIDSQLQKLAEELLAQNEAIRDEQLEATISRGFSTWVKGGSIVVMDPHTGHILAFASYPRFDVELFSQKSFRASPNPPENNKGPPFHSKHFWLEDGYWIAGLWDGKWSLWRESYNRGKKKFEWESKRTNWQNYVETIAGSHSPLVSFFQQVHTYGELADLSSSFIRIKSFLGKDINSWDLINYLYARAQDIPYLVSSSGSDEKMRYLEQRWQEVSGVVAIDADRKRLDEILSNLKSNFDKMLAVELAALLCGEKPFDYSRSKIARELEAEQYRQDLKIYLSLESEVKQLLEKWHKDIAFERWRKLEQRAFIKAARREEAANRSVAKPYLYYLEKERKAQFQQLWQEKRQDLLETLIGLSACLEENLEIVDYIKSRLEKASGFYESDLTSSFARLKKVFDEMGFEEFTEYVGSMRSYEKLKQEPLLASYVRLKYKNEPRRSDLAAMIYPRYGLGYMQQKAISEVSPPGSIFKLVVAYKALLQRYEAGFNSFDTMSPFTMIDSNYKSGDRMVVGRWPSGKEIHQIYHGGRIPKSQRRSIGKVDLLGAIESSSNPYFSLLAESFLDDGPQDILNSGFELGYGHLTGIDLPFEKSGSMPFDLAYNKTGLFTTAIGQHTMLSTPLQAAVMMSAFANGGQILRPKVIDDGLQKEIKSQIYLPEHVREYILEGMRRVVSGEQGSARSASLVSYGPGSPERKTINQMIPYMVGKTSTAEFVESFGLSPTKYSPKHSNVWFAGIVFDQPLYRSGFENQRTQFQGRTPELVIVVCLKYGRFGKEAFPIAAMLAKKWKELQADRFAEKKAQE